MQDAAWEVDESTAFDDLLERYGHCDAEECLCPDGRTEDVDYTPWEVILCRCCGAQGIHLRCGNLPANVEHPKWTCSSCKKVLSVLPPTYLNHYSRVAKESSTVDLKSRDILLSTTFILGDDGLPRVAKTENARITASTSDERPVTAPISDKKPVIISVTPKSSVEEPEIKRVPAKDEVVILHELETEVTESPRKRKELEVKCDRDRMIKRLKKTADAKQSSILTYFSAKSPKKTQDAARKLVS